MAFKAGTIKVRVEDQEEAENFLLGLIVAQTNNSSPLFPQLIEGVNAMLEGAKKDALDEAMAARAEAGMP